MNRSLLAATGMGVAVFFSIPSPGFQGPLTEAQVTVTPRARPRAETQEALMRVDSMLVTVPARISTAGGAPVTTLRKEDFRLFEDNIEQDIVHFSRTDAPVSIGLLFDMSGSMSNKIQKSAEAVSEFFKTANPADEFFLIKFNDRAKLSVPFTTDPDTIYTEVLRSSPFGQTSLLDAIYLATKQMKKARNQFKAVVIVSDGGDNWSRHSIHEIKEALLESDVTVYAMGIFDWNYMSKHAAEERRGPVLLDELAEQTGGRHFPVDDLNSLPAISAQISRLIRDQYELGYYPTNPARDGKYRRLKLMLKVAEPAILQRLHADYRRGYYAPAQ
jgi:Ca-activated chloride channel homolog